MKLFFTTIVFFSQMIILYAQVESGEFFFSFSGKRINKIDSAFIHDVVIKKDLHHFSVEHSEKFTGYWETEKLEFRQFGDSLIHCESNNTDYYYKRIGSSLYDVRIFKNSKLITEGRAVSVIPLYKEGIWLIYNENTGEKIREDIYMENAYVGNQRYDEKGQKLLQSVFLNAQKMPVYEGNIKELDAFVKALVEKSDCYNENKQNGIIYGSFVVTELGEVTEYKLENTFNPCLDQIALYALKQLPSRWKPGIIEGKKVRVLVTLPIRF